MNGHTGRNALLLLSFLVVIFVGCAEVGSPPGGEIDRKPPVLLSSVPADGALAVPPNNKITLVFSERIVKPTSGDPVFVSPRPEIAPDVDWKSDRIIVTLADSFRTNQTYLVSVASTVADLRNNKLDSTLTIAFTTGLSLDSGRISGHVRQKDKGVSAALVGLFPRGILSDTAALDSLVPEYMTVANNEGYFSFSYLSPDSFLMVAWKDQNRDNVFAPNSEPYAIPDRPVAVSDALPRIDGVTLPLNESVYPLPWKDTVVAGIISALYTENKLVRVRLSQPVPTSLLSKQPGNALLRKPDDSLRVFPAKGVLESDAEETTALSFFFGDIEAGVYDLQVSYDGKHKPMMYDSLTIEAREDKTPPKIESTRPDDPKVFFRDAQMAITFTEPLIHDSISSETFALWENDSIPVPVAHRWIDPFRIGFTAQLRPGRNYRLDATAFDLMDLAGNLLGDSLFSHSFGIFDSDSLGSVTGSIALGPTHTVGDNVVISFDKVGRNEGYTVTARGNTYRIDLPAGRYLISAFLDANLDGKLTDGRLVPYQPSESRTMLADTIAVRARFETAGVDITFD